MNPGQGSRTAERVAERRAAHQVVDDPRVFEDPLALSIIRPNAARVLRDDPRKHDSSAFSRYLRAFVSMRSRFAEDALRDAYGRGVRQYLILGAGFDTFAYRNPYPDLRVFELDHPDTQAVKRARLAHAGIVMPPALTLVAADLAQASLGDALAAARFDMDAPVFVAWLGVSMYLLPADVATTLRFIGARPAGSCVVLDYAVPPSSIGWIGRVFYRVLLRRLARVGEPWQTFFEPATLVAQIQAAGLTVEEDLGQDEINARYFSGRTDGLRVSAAGRIARACVRPPHTLSSTSL